MHETAGQPPHHLVLQVADPNARKQFIRLHRMSDFGVMSCIQETCDGNPDDILNLFVSPRANTVRHFENETADHDPRRVATMTTLLIVQTTHEMRLRQIDAHLLQRLALCSVARVVVENLYHTPGEGHLTRPGIMVMSGAFDEKYFDGVGYGPEYESHRSMLIVAKLEFRGPMVADPVRYGGD